MIVPTISDVLSSGSYRSAIPLARYAQKIGYPECQFFGVRNDNTHVGYQCREIWSASQRHDIAFYLSEAQLEIEQEIGYPLQLTWVTGTAEADLYGGNVFVDAQVYRVPLLARWNMVIAPGVRAETVIEAGVVVNHATDPAVVTVATAVTDSAEIAIYHPGSAVTIVPSSIQISGGMATILIPRCRLVTLAASDNPSTGLDYNDLTNFETAVDVSRVYNDTTTQAVLTKCPNGRGVCSETCTVETQTACIEVDKARVGALRIRPADYADGSWTYHGGCGGYRNVQLNYLAGARQLTLQAEDAITRLAHSKMPSTPCGCNSVMNMWKEDRKVPQVITRERLNCPFGMSDGAWTAYRFAQTMAIRRLGVL